MAKTRTENYYLNIKNTRTGYTKLVPRAKGLRMILGLAKTNGYDMLGAKLKDEYEVA